MSVRNAEISGILTRWLERYSPPANIRENARAQQDEANALLSVLLKFAPQDGAGDWVARALDKLEYQMKTRAWPTKGELGAVCSNLRKEGPRTVDLTAPDQDDASRAARRMAAGEPVGEGWLYGIGACELIARQLVSETTMRGYRSGAFLARKSRYGEDEARRWEVEAMTEHEAAKSVWRQREGERQGRSIEMPNKTSALRMGDAA